MVGTLSGLMLSVLLASLDQTIVGTAEPRIIASLSGFDRYPWVSTAYLLCSTISVPIFAKLSDIYGRKWFLLGGSGGFVLASTLCGAAGKINFLGLDGMNQLILFRAIQGIGGGIRVLLPVLPATLPATGFHGPVNKVGSSMVTSYSRVSPFRVKRPALESRLALARIAASNLATGPSPLTVETALWEVYLTSKGIR